MNCHFHPKPETLIRYASGNLSPAYSTAIELHTQFCSGCNASVNEFEAIGGRLLEEQLNSSILTSFESLMDRIENETQQTTTQDNKENNLVSDILSNANFTKKHNDKKRLTSKISTIAVDIQDANFKSEIYYIKSGAKVPKHTHKGQEITVILRGSFEDIYGKYSIGDYVVRNASDLHSPRTSEECICFAITDAPLDYKGFFGPIINRIVARV